MLTRRAAGMFPQNHWGADLFIPIFHPRTKKVSMILIQVKNRASRDSDFPASATSDLYPTRVFDESMSSMEWIAMRLFAFIWT